jgi:hypothetical protein
MAKGRAQGKVVITVAQNNLMTKENFLTMRWNNLLTLGIGIPTLAYVVVALSTSLWLGRGGLIGLSIFGALF